MADYIIPRGLDFDESGKDFRDTSPIPAAYDLEKGEVQGGVAVLDDLDDHGVDLHLAGHGVVGVFLQPDLVLGLPVGHIVGAAVDGVLVGCAELVPAAYDLEKGKAYWEQAKQELNLPEYTLRVQTGESPASSLSNSGLLYRPVLA